MICHLAWRLMRISHYRTGPNLILIDPKSEVGLVFYWIAKVESIKLYLEIFFIAWNCIEWHESMY